MRVHIFKVGKCKLYVVDNHFSSNKVNTDHSENNQISHYEYQHNKELWRQICKSG